MTFKKGDLVMVVKPSLCCKSTKAIGQIHTVGDQVLIKPISTCVYCHHRTLPASQVLLSCGRTIEKSRLIKIDQPADQDQETKDKKLEVLG